MKQYAIIFFLFSLTLGAIDPPPCGLVTCKRVYHQFETYIEAYKKAMQGIQDRALPLVPRPAGVEQTIHDAIVQRVAALEADLKAKGLDEVALQRDKGQLEERLKKAEDQVLEQQKRHGDFKRDTLAALQDVQAEVIGLRKVKNQLEVEQKDLLVAIQAEAARARTEIIKALQKHASHNQGMLPVAKVLAEAGVQVEVAGPKMTERAVQVGERHGVKEVSVQAQESPIFKVAEASVQVEHEKPAVAKAELVDAEIQVGGAQVTKTERDLLHQLWQLLCGSQSESAPKEYGTEDYEEAIRTVIERVAETRQALAARERDLDELMSRKERLEKLYKEALQKKHKSDSERFTEHEKNGKLQEELSRSLREKRVMEKDLGALQIKINTFELENQFQLLEIERLNDAKREDKERIRKLEEDISIARLDAKEARDSERKFMDMYEEILGIKKRLEEEKSRLEESVRELTAEGERLDHEEYEEAQKLGDMRYSMSQIRSILEDGQELPERKLELILDVIGNLHKP